MRIAWVLSIAGLCAACGHHQNTSAPTPPQDFEAAVHDVMVHDDLSDINFLSKTLGLGLRVTQANSGSNPKGDASFRAIPMLTPPFLFASGLEYQAKFDSWQRLSTYELKFIPRSCPPIERWGRDWGKEKETEWQLIPDEGGTSTSLTWDGSDSVKLQTIASVDGCTGVLRQARRDRFHILAPPSLPKTQDGDIAQRAAAILFAGDLRDYRKTASILRAELVPLAQLRNGLVYDGSVALAQPVPGLDASGFEYSVNDKGWAVAHFLGRFGVDRTAWLVLPVDLDTLCVSEKDLVRALDLPSASRMTVRIQDGAYSLVGGENAVSLSIGLVNQCIRTFTFQQNTDIKHAIFTADVSLDRDSRSLSTSAQQAVSAVMKRSGSPSGQHFGLVEYESVVAKQEDKALALRLQDQLRAALLAGGVDPAHLILKAGVKRQGSYPDVEANAFVVLEVKDTFNALP